MKKRKERDVSDCPRCGEEEDAPHVWSCKGPGAIERWTIAVEKLREELAKMKTPSVVRTAICATLLAWKSGSAMPTTRLQLRGLERAMHEQSKIGWSNFLEGRLSLHWRYVMDQHYRRIGSKKW